MHCSADSAKHHMAMDKKGDCKLSALPLTMGKQGLTLQVARPFPHPPNTQEGITVLRTSPQRIAKGRRLCCCRKVRLGNRWRKGSNHFFYSTVWSLLIL